MVVGIVATRMASATHADKLARAQRLLDENRYDLEAWSYVLHSASAQSIDAARPTYERLVSVFHSSGRFWRLYIEQEMKARNYDRVEKLFQRSLVKVLSIDLWRLYLAYVKDAKSSLSTFNEKMAQAYDFALDKVGLDYHAYSIFSDYITFLKGFETVGSYAENQKITAIRKVYHKGVATPMLHVESLWKDYMTFENGINPIIAEKMNMEHSRDHNQAKRVAREMESEVRGLNRNLPSVPPSGTGEEQRQVGAWQRFLAWERTNPLHTEDMTLWVRRVTYAYEQCLLCLGHHPDVWHEFTLFLQEAGRLMSEKGDVSSARSIADDTAQVYQRAVHGHLRRCMLVHFAYADFEEARHNVEKVHTIYASLLEVEDIDPTLAYIQYMKFARRVEGIQAARKVFKKAREDSRSQHHVFVAAALMEYYCSKNKEVAFKVFELGLKRFGDSTQYILNYIDYLSHLNEDNNTRVLFERVLSSGVLDECGSAQIWNRFLEFECNVGDLASIVNVEKRRSALLQRMREFDGKQTAQLVDRYRFLDLFPCSRLELRAIGYDGRAIGDPSRSTPRDLEPDPAAPVRPDLSQMMPFKPKQVWVPGEHPVPGGGFPLPPAALALCRMMPPPRCFHGPFVAVDRLMQLVASTPASLAATDSSLSADSSQNGVQGVSHFQTAMGARWSMPGAKKRPPGTAGSDDEGTNSAPPINDIYRQRQQKRVK